MELTFATGSESISYAVRILPSFPLYPLPAVAPFHPSLLRFLVAIPFDWTRREDLSLMMSCYVTDIDVVRSFCVWVCGRVGLRRRSSRRHRSSQRIS